MGHQSIRRRILVPLMLTFLLLLLTFTFGIYHIKIKEIDGDLARHYEVVEILSRELRYERFMQMSLALQMLSRDPLLRSAMKNADRDRLYAMAQDIFHNNFAPNGISHLYFHRPDGRVFLRVHRPESYDDTPRRETLRLAMANGTLSSGSEFGPFGNFSYRVVLPWYEDGHLLGYLEAAEDVGLFMKRLRDRFVLEYAVIVEKRFLDERIFEKSATPDSGFPHSREMPNHLILDSSLPALPKDLAMVLALEHAEHFSHQMEVDSEGRVLRGRLLPLTDVTGSEVGDILVMVDVTEQLSFFNRSMVTGGSITLLSGGILFVLSYGFLGRVAGRLRDAQSRLLSEYEIVKQTNEKLEEEMTARLRAQKALEEANDELERRVALRTAELKAALHDSRQDRRRIDAILRSVTDGLVVIDQRGYVLLMNERAREMFSLVGQAVEGRSLELLLRQSVLLPRILQALAGEAGTRAVDFEYEDERQGLRILQARVSFIRARGTEPEGILILFQDVTESRNVDRMKSEFISTVAHEFRTPLATVLGFSELLLSRDDFDEVQRREFLTYIHQKADNLSAIVDDLLDISRIESGRGLELHREIVAPQESFDAVIRDARLQHPAFVIEAQLQPAVPGLWIDRRKCAQVMENLLSNAVKYSAGQRRVHIQGQVSDGAYEVQVRDWGIGMTPEQSARVFEKFYRADASNVAVSGTGLGMSIVKHIVEAHGGRIWLESAPGAGTCVHFTLPLADHTSPMI